MSISWPPQVTCACPGALRILALDPTYDTLFPASSSSLADDVRAAVTRVKGKYADIGQPLANHAERVAADGADPNDAGHRAIARAVLTQLRRSTVSP